MTSSAAAVISLPFVIPDRSTVLNKRINIALVISSTYSLFQGDPDSDNLPRTDPESGKSFGTPQGFTRKMRDVWAMQGREIHIARRATLSLAIKEEGRTLGFDMDDVDVEDVLPAAEGAETPEMAPEAAAEKVEAKKAKKGAKGPKKAQQLTPEQKDQLVRALAKRYIDVRTFGGVMTTINEGVTGPCQVSFAVSVDPVAVLNLAVTRVAVASEAEAAKHKDRTMGRLAVTPFALYRQEISFSPYEAQKTGYTWGDFEDFLKNLQLMFDLTKSKSRSQVVLEKAVVFYHSNELGDERSHKLFRRVKVRNSKDEVPARSFDDYTFEVDTAGLTSNIKVEVLD